MGDDEKKKKKHYIHKHTHTHYHTHIGTSGPTVGIPLEELGTFHFNNMIVFMLAEEWVQLAVAAVDLADLEGTASAELMNISSWRWLVENSQSAASALIEVAGVKEAGKSKFRLWPSGDLFNWIYKNYIKDKAAESEVSLGPWDTDRDHGYDSGMCDGCHYSNYLIGGKCPIYDACDVC